MMKKFLRHILIFTLPIIAVTIGFEIYLRTFETEYRQKTNGLDKIAKDLQVLILGNSHGYNGINPKKFDLPAYNMAGGNQSLYFDRRITAKYMDQLPQLKYVLISVDFHSLYFSSTGIRDTWLYYGYGIKYKDRSEIKNNLSYFWFGYTPRISISLVKDKLKKFIKGEHNAALIDGWSPSEGNNLAAFTPKNIRYKASWFNDVAVESDERESNLEDLDHFIQFLKDNGIEPILYTLPMRSEIYPFLDSNITQQNSEDLSFLMNKHNVPYLDFTSAEFIAEEDFYNEDHLNRSGADKVSEKINAFIMELDSTGALAN